MSESGKKPQSRRIAALARLTILIDEREDFFKDLGDILDNSEHIIAAVKQRQMAGNLIRALWITLKWSSAVIGLIVAYKTFIGAGK